MQPQQQALHVSYNSTSTCNFLPPPANRPSQQCHKCRKNRGADHSPHNWKRPAFNVDGKNFGKAKLPGDPHAEVCTYETHHDGNKATAQIVTCKRLANGATNGGDNEKHQESDKCHAANVGKTRDVRQEPRKKKDLPFCFIFKSRTFSKPHAERNFNNENSNPKQLQP